MKNLSIKHHCYSAKGSTLAVIMVTCGVHAGCVSTESAYSLGGATLGGLSGALASVQNPKIAPFVAAGSAAVGGLIGGMAIKSVKSGRYIAYQEGYQQGASDTTKRQYWILQNLQKEQNKKTK